MYLTTDLGSAHWEKRVEWLGRNGISVDSIGFGVQWNQGSVERGEDYFILMTRSFVARAFLALIIFFKNYKKIKKETIIVRGFEFELLCSLSNLKFISEYTDINPMQKRGAVLYRCQKWIFAKAQCVAVTSPGFLDYYELARCDRAVVWHNLPPSSHIPNEDAKANRQRAVVYCGFVRNFDRIRSMSEYIAVDVFGVFNLLGNEYGRFVSACGETVQYRGSYDYGDLPLIYTRYWFAYVDDSFNDNSFFNLTNRLYESVYGGGCIPVARRSTSVLSRFMAEHEIGVVFNSESELVELKKRSVEELADLSERARVNLKRAVGVDHRGVEDAFRSCLS